jgi:hypothetical protein
VAFEFRSKDKHPAWRALWDWCIFGGSLVPALLLLRPHLSPSPLAASPSAKTARIFISGFLRTEGIEGKNLEA